MHISKGLAVFLFGIIIIIALLFIGVFSYSRALPAAKQSLIAARSTTPILRRSYPSVIAGNWEPSTWHLDAILKKEVNNLKKLGVNTLSVVPHYDYKNGAPRLADRSEKKYVDRIIRAKKQGFAVLITPDFVGGDNNKIPVPLSQFLDDTKKISLYWASIAEKYQVEFFAPQNEFDWVIRFSFFDDNPQKFEDAISISNQWHRDILAELKKIYKGKTMYKFASRSEHIDGTGYDYVGVDFGHNERPLEQFRADITRLYEITATIARNSGNQWLVGEAWMPYQKRKGPLVGGVLRTHDGQSIDELQDDFFQAAIDAYIAFDGQPKPQGFFFIAYIMPSMNIKGRPAEEVIRAFYQKLGAVDTPLDRR